MPLDFHPVFTFSPYPSIAERISRDYGTDDGMGLTWRERKSHQTDGLFKPKICHMISNVASTLWLLRHESRSHFLCFAL